MGEYKIYLDDFCEDIFHAMEEISEGINGHECLVGADDKEHAADKITTKLKKFIISRMETV